MNESYWLTHLVEMVKDCGGHVEITVSTAGDLAAVHVKSYRLRHWEGELAIDSEPFDSLEAAKSAAVALVKLAEKLRLTQ